jgi:hypothetical protein
VGEIIPSNEPQVFFGTDDSTRLIGQNPINAEAGTATSLIECDQANPTATIYALSIITRGDQTRIFSAAASPNGTRVNNYTVRYTTDGSPPSAASPEYRNPHSSASAIARRHPG